MKCEFCAYEAPSYTGARLPMNPAERMEEALDLQLHYQAHIIADFAQALRLLGKIYKELPLRR